MKSKTLSSKTREREPLSVKFGWMIRERVEPVRAERIGGVASEKFSEAPPSQDYEPTDEKAAVTPTEGKGSERSS